METRLWIVNMQGHERRQSWSVWRQHPGKVNKSKNVLSQDSDDLSEIQNWYLPHINLDRYL
jgi:hypothetical protein